MESKIYLTEGNIMESTFYKVRKIRVVTVINPGRAGAAWLQINVCDQDGEHVINCFSENDEGIPMSLHPGDEDDHG